MLKDALNKSSGKRARRIGMGCKAQTAAIANAMARICNTADRPSPPMHATRGLGQSILQLTRLAAAVVATLALPLNVCASTAQAQLQKFVNTVTAASGDFVQTQVSDANQTNTQSGVFAFERPGKFRWEVRTPYAQLVVSDGARVLQYDPDLAQVTERSLDATMGASPAAILFGTAKFEDAFTVSNLPDDADLAWLRAQPRASDAGFTYVDIGFRSDKPVRLLLLDVFGQTTRIDLNAMHVHAQLAPDTFRFDIPADVDVVRMP